MGVSRREFLKISGAGTAGAMLGLFGLDLRPVHAYTKPLRIDKIKPTTTICCYCGVGCGIIVHSKDNKVINLEGDPDHPINQGALCSKGLAIYQVANNERRNQKVLYRAPGGDKWEEKPWDWAIKKIAKNIKETRDKEFIEKDGGKTVNRLEAVAMLGGAALDNEECYAGSKLARTLGVVYLEHQARI